MNLREVEIFKPYGNEFPEYLMLDAGCPTEAFAHWENSELLRIAKRGHEILGLYAMERRNQDIFELFGVIVEPQVRKQGLGRWLVGHAIGVAESKGGRRVTLPHTGASRCFAHIGFQPAEVGWFFDLIPE